jgi:hypothetical protein
VLAPLLAEILARSQAAGTVRADLAVSDMVVGLLSVRAIADVCDSSAGARPSLRFLELVLYGFRPATVATPLGPALSVSQLDGLLRQR